MVTADVETALKKYTPGRSAGFILVFGPSPEDDIMQGITAGRRVVGILRSNDPKEFKYTAGEEFWTGGQWISIRVFLLEQPRTGS
jgi:hypothetical protein